MSGVMSGEPQDRETTGKIVAWKLNVANPQFASVRYRCLMPLMNLADVGVQSIVLGGNDDLRDFRQVQAIIFVKTFSNHDLDLARRAKAAGVPVFFDLCDNVFIDEYGGASNGKIRRNTLEICGLAQAVVTTGPAMVDKLRAELPETIPIRIVPDQVERRALTERLLQDPGWRSDPWQIRVEEPFVATPLSLRIRRALLGGRTRSGHMFRRLLRQMCKTSAAEWAPATRYIYWMLPCWLRRTYLGRTLRDPAPLLLGLRRRLGFGPRTPVDTRIRKTIVWFGHHGSGHGRYGMLTVADIAHHLQQIDKENPIRLLIVSDDHRKFRQLFSDLGFPAEFRKWNPLGVFADIAGADVCIVPNSKDAFSITKSANRVVMALSLGVPVVATRIPSIEPLESCIILDDWTGGLRRYLTDPELVQKHLAIAAGIIERSYSGRYVAATWADLLDRPIAPAIEASHRNIGPDEAADLRVSA